MLFFETKKSTAVDEVIYERRNKTNGRRKKVMKGGKMRTWNWFNITLVIFLFGIAFGAGKVYQQVQSLHKTFDKEFGDFKEEFTEFEKEVREDFKDLGNRMWGLLTLPSRFGGQTANPGLTASGRKIIESEPLLKQAIEKVYEQDKDVLPDQIFNKIEKGGFNLRDFDTISKRREVSQDVLIGIVVMFADELRERYNGTPLNNKQTKK